MIKSAALLLIPIWVLILSLTAMPESAAAVLCRNFDDRSICVLKIQRSAKNYWEYRAAVRVDGIEYPIEVYNCRTRTRVQPDGTTVPFEAEGAGKLVCRLYKQ